MSTLSALLIYGLPCSGKSGVLRVLDDFHAIAVDEIIKKMVAEPSVADFDRLSEEIVKHVVREVDSRESENYIIEMGCLITRRAIVQLERSLVELGCTFFNIKLSADDGELVQRIIKRNRDIDSGDSNGIKVDGPDYLTRFKQVFDVNQPDNLIELDTTGKTAEDVLLEIIKRTIVD